MATADVSRKGWLALGTFALQNGLGILLMRYSKIHSEPYSSQVAVLMQELVVKLPISAALYSAECGGVLVAIRSVRADLRRAPVEWAQLGVPALLYTVQNTLLYVGFANVEAAVGQVTYQTKILWTALFSVLVLDKRLTNVQWLALAVLACGVLAVQGTAQGSHPAAAADDPALGVAALVLAAVCTSFASVYFEKMLKGASNPSLWLRNVQMAAYSSAFAAAGVLLRRDPAIAQRGWLGGFGQLTWASVYFQGAGGIIVAVTIKYADNILRGFAQGLALIVGAIGSWLLFSFQVTLSFCVGVLLVSLAIFLYGSPMQTPHELLDACARCGATLCCRWRQSHHGRYMATVSDEIESSRGASLGPAPPAGAPPPNAATNEAAAMTAVAAKPGGTESSTLLAR